MAPRKSDLTAVENKGEKNGCLSFAILPPPYQLLQLLPLACVWSWYVTVVSELGVGDRSYLEPRIVVRAMPTPPRCSQVPLHNWFSLGKNVTCVLNRILHITAQSSASSSTNNKQTTTTAQTVVVVVAVPDVSSHEVCRRLSKDDRRPRERRTMTRKAPVKVEL